MSFNFKILISFNFSNFLLNYVFNMFSIIFFFFLFVSFLLFLFTMSIIFLLLLLNSSFILLHVFHIYHSYFQCSIFSLHFWKWLFFLCYFIELLAQVVLSVFSPLSLLSFYILFVCSFNRSDKFLPPKSFWFLHYGFFLSLFFKILL